MSAVVKIPRRMVSAKNRPARNAKKPRQLAPNLPHQNDKNYCNINYLRLGWGARIRTWEWRNQNPLPYHLATPQRAPDHTCASGPDQSPDDAGVTLARSQSLNRRAGCQGARGAVDCLT